MGSCTGSAASGRRVAFAKQGTSPRALCCQLAHFVIYCWPPLVSADFKVFPSLCQFFGAIVQSTLRSELVCYQVWILHGAIPLTAETEPTIFSVQDWEGKA